MYKFLQLSKQLLRTAPDCLAKAAKRTFLSQSYYCNEVWEHRLNNSILQKVQLDELYQELEQRYQRTKEISAVDVDVFANSITDPNYVNELLDLVHKLRLSAESSNVLISTEHAVVRFLYSTNHRDDLLTVVDDRLNYGVFLDYYTANLLMDYYHKAKDYVAGVVIASQLTLQEEFSHSLSNALAIHHCYHYLIGPREWLPEKPKPEEPEDEVKVRVKYLRNPYDNDFDIKDPLQLIGNILTGIAKNSKTDILSRSLHVLGLALINDVEKAKKCLKTFKPDDKLLEDIIKLMPQESSIKDLISDISTESKSIAELIKELVKQAEIECSEKDIADQCSVYSDWETNRKLALEAQQERLLKLKRLADVEKAQEHLKQRERLLWFFENEEKIELEIQQKLGKSQGAAKTDQINKKAAAEEEYIPPEVTKRLGAN